MSQPSARPAPGQRPAQTSQPQSHSRQPSAAAAASTDALGANATKQSADEYKRGEDSTDASTPTSISSTTVSSDATKTPIFSSALERTVQSAHPSDDLLDSASFDPIAYINSKFVDEQSVSGGKLDTYLHDLRSQVATINDSISKSLRKHTLSRTTSIDAVNNANAIILQLFQRIQTIKKQAELSELQVQTITKDIKSLDAAKHNLTGTTLALKNLHMLQSAIVQLDLVIAEGDWLECSKLLHAINDLFTLFHKYKDVSKIQVLYQKVQQTKLEVKETLFTQLKAQLMSPTVNQEPTQLQVASQCLVIDALDDKQSSDTDKAKKDAATSQSATQQLLDWWCEQQLADYVQLFGSTGSNATFDLIERRYAWLRRCWGLYKERYDQIYPPQWHAQLQLTQAFCKVTKSQINRLLSAQKPDTAAMIKALQKTIEFEKEMTIRFAATIDLNKLDPDDEIAKTQAVRLIKEKYLNEGTEQHPTEVKGSSKEVEFAGAISSVFTPYLSSYVEMERSDIRDLLQKIDREEQWHAGAAVIQTTNRQPGAMGDDTAPVNQKSRYNSSDEFFLYIRNSIQRCSKLTRGLTFYHLYNEYQRGLQQYAELLTAHIPFAAQQQYQSQIQSATNPNPTIESASQVSLLTANDMTQICFLLNTAQYCADTTGQLEETIQRMIDEEFKPKISLTATIEKFTILIHRCLQSLVLNVCMKIQRALTAMSKMQWDTWASVGDESNYIKHIDAILRDDLPQIAQRVQERYYSTLSNSLSSNIIPRYIDTIFRCKKITDIGAQQMSLDAQVLKRILLNIPDYIAQNPVATTAPAAVNADGDGDAAATAGGPKKKVNLANRLYAKYVQTEMSKADALLKALVSPSDRIIVTFKALLPKSSMDDLVRVMQMKGLRRQEQQQLVNAYNATVAPEDHIRMPANVSGLASTIAFASTGITDIGTSLAKLGR